MPNIQCLAIFHRQHGNSTQFWMQYCIRMWGTNNAGATTTPITICDIGCKNLYSVTRLTQAVNTQLHDALRYQGEIPKQAIKYSSVNIRAPLGKSSQPRRLKISSNAVRAPRSIGCISVARLGIPESKIQVNYAVTIRNKQMDCNQPKRDELSDTTSGETWPPGVGPFPIRRKSQWDYKSK